MDICSSSFTLITSVVRVRMFYISKITCRQYAGASPCYSVGGNCRGGTKNTSHCVIFSVGNGVFFTTNDLIIVFFYNPWCCLYYVRICSSSFTLITSAVRVRMFCISKVTCRQYASASPCYTVGGNCSGGTKNTSHCVTFSVGNGVFFTVVSRTWPGKRNGHF